MRLFAALPLPAAAREAVRPLLDALRATGWPVRWIDVEQAHVTLKFFGEVEPAREPAIAQALAEASRGTGPIDLQFTALGAFPTPRRPRVLWLGLDAPAALELLADRVERVTEPLGFPGEGRPWRPHVTLGRVRADAALPPRALQQFRGPVPDTAFLVEEAVLFVSALGPGGARYTPRATVPLAA